LEDSSHMSAAASAFTMRNPLVSTSPLRTAPLALAEVEITRISRGRWSQAQITIGLRGSAPSSNTLPQLYQHPNQYEWESRSGAAL